MAPSQNVSSENLPVYTEMKWKPNEDAIPDLIFKDKTEVAKIKKPK